MALTDSRTPLLPGIDANAAPQRARWSSKPWHAPRTATYVGIDIGEQDVRIATMRLLGQQPTELAWTDSHRFDLPVQPEQHVTTQWLQSVLSEIPNRLPRCIEGEANITAIALPIAWTHYQTVLGNEIPLTRQRCDRMFADSVFQSAAHLCHWPVIGVHHGKPCSDDRYVIAATAERTACHVADSVWAKGYTVQSILPHGVVLAHAAGSLTGVDAQCVVWLSHSSALIAVCHQSGVGLARTLPSVPQHILDLGQSEQPLDSKLLSPYLSVIAAEFSATARYAAQADMSMASKKPILIAGPIAEIQGVDEALATLTNTPVAVWSYIGNHRPAPLAKHSNQSPEFIRRLDSSYATALSLAWAATQGSSRGYRR